MYTQPGGVTRAKKGTSFFDAQAIKANGGMTMVREPTTAQYDGMPRSAAATGMVDYLLSIEQMPETLLKYVRHFYIQASAPRAAERRVAWCDPPKAPVLALRRTALSGTTAALGFP
ncbi:MAG: chemotaxis protein CheB [Cyanobacteriota bacterium]|nr:chemotaxis protein CheB [Cyanobacteriota bacterium]